MVITWFGQSAFLLTGGKATVLIDPHGDTENLRSRGMRFDYPLMDGIEADVLLITHEHVDHNGEEKVSGNPQVFRSRAGSFESAAGPITGVASEHDPVAGTQRGDNTIFVFDYDKKRICHLGDLGQSNLRPQQLAAIDRPDVLFVPVGGTPTIGPGEAISVIEEINPTVVIPMHYRTEVMDFLKPIDPFLDAVGTEIDRLDSNSWDSASTSFERQNPLVVVPSLPS